MIILSQREFSEAVAAKEVEQVVAAAEEAGVKPGFIKRCLEGGKAGLEKLKKAIVDAYNGASDVVSEAGKKLDKSNREVANKVGRKLKDPNLYNDKGELIKEGENVAEEAWKATKGAAEKAGEGIANGSKSAWKAVVKGAKNPYISVPVGTAAAAGIGYGIYRHNKNKGNN